MSVKCPKCQAENPDTQKFCGECATSLQPSKDIGITKTIATPATGLQKGSTFAGRYKISEELGRGGMGVVYKAEDTKLKRTVALKFLPPELTHIPDVKDRFMREAQAAAALDHPNICTVYEFDEAEEKTFISMAYVEGQSLRKKLESGPLELDEAIRIATQAAQGLQIAHKKGVVHRDIKSANIMVTEDNQAKIMDFGLARMTGGTLLTQEGTAMGTIAYMSPEQAQGEEVDHRTDIWSLGVVLYEILTGQLPFKGEHEQAIVYAIRKDKPRPITEVNAEIPQSIEQVVDKALEKDADKRYQQVDELLDDLKSISAGIVPEEIKARLRKAKLLKRKRSILYAGAGGLVIVIAVLALTLFTGRAEAIDSIAVLPLRNQTGDAEQEYFVDGVTDELIGQLAQLSGLRRVISRTTVMEYKGMEKSLPEIAKELNVDALVEGTVYHVGDNVRIRLQLIDALPEERNLWAQTYERAMTDVLIMYSEMAQSIADKMQVKLTSEEKTHFTRTQQVNPAAYDAYLKGMSHWYKLTPKDIETALQHFESALESDPDYALAYTGIALVWIGRNQGVLVLPSEAARHAKEAALKALSLDNTLAEVHYVLGLIRTWMDWDWENAEAAFLRALELKPNYPDARVYYSNLLCYMGRLEEALEQGGQAIRMDPYNLLFRGIYGLTLIMARRNDDAFKLAQDTLKTSPADVIAHAIIRDVLHLKGMEEEALKAVKRCYTGFGLTAIAEAMDREYEKNGYSSALNFAGNAIEELSRDTNIFLPPGILEHAYLYAGNKNKVLELLEKSFEIKDPNMPYIIEPIFTDFLGDDPRFQDLLRKMNLPVDEKE